MVLDLRTDVSARHAQEAHRARSFQAYHSAYNDDADARLVGSMSILPIRTKSRGPAPPPGEYQRMFFQVNAAVHLRTGREELAA